MNIERFDNDFLSGQYDLDKFPTNLHKYPMSMLLEVDRYNASVGLWVLKEYGLFIYYL